jgi:hypothetical protein
MENENVDTSNTIIDASFVIFIQPSIKNKEKTYEIK